MQFVKQSTSSIIAVGPFVDASDGFTPETGVTLGAADAAEMIKHDAASVTDLSSNTFTAITGADGLYNLTLTSGQLSDLGRCTVYIADTSVCRPVRIELMVLPANVYDSLFSTDYLQVDVLQINGNASSGFLSGTTALNSDVTKISGDATAADNLEEGCTGIVTSTVASGSTTTTIKTNLSATDNDFYNGRTIVFTSGTQAGEAKIITDYNGTSKDITVAALTLAPANADTFVIV